MLTRSEFLMCIFVMVKRCDQKLQREESAKNIRVFIDRVLKKLIVSMIAIDRVQGVNSRLIKISPGWQGGARAYYKYAKGFVASLSVVARRNPGCWSILVYCSMHKPRVLEHPCLL